MKKIIDLKNGKAKYPDNGNSFIVLNLAVSASKKALFCLKNCPKKYEFLADQIRRSAVSIALNIAEGSGRGGQDRIYHYRVAYASALECKTGFDILSSVNCVNPACFDETNNLIDQVRAFLYKLINRK